MVGWNDVLRFLLELGALAALAYWGFSTRDGAAAWALGLGAPFAAAVFWGLFVAPKARFPVSRAGRVVLGLAVFGLAAAALADAGEAILAIVFGALALLNATIMLARLSSRSASRHLHGPILPRNPELADLLLGWALGEDLELLASEFAQRAREERIAEARRAARRKLGVLGRIR
jgi:hypothetical protein